jgi:ribosomal protein S12 methylthiotransferase
MGVDEKNIRDVHPGVLSVTGPHQYQAVVEAVHAVVPPVVNPFMDLLPPEGIKLTPRHYSYLKISEGCNHTCSFCIIPSLRGGLVSRPAGKVLAEAERLANAGVKELLVVSQDTGAYGLDLGYEASEWRGQPVKARMTELADALGDLGIWVRMHYVYPYPHVDELIPLMAQGKILPYLDIPFQHASTPVLRAMKRPASQDKVLDRIKKWRDICPELTIRSTFIVGFPGETEEDFETLLDFLDEAQLDRVGCFKYEAVEGAPANALPDPVDEDDKEERYHRLMETQRQISEQRMLTKVGQTLEVIIDTIEDDGVVGRSQADAPEIDGNVYLDLDDAEGLSPGDIVQVEIDEADEYDLWGSVVGEPL